MYKVIGTISRTVFGTFPSVAACVWAIEDLTAVFGTSCQSFAIVKVRS